MNKKPQRTTEELLRSIETDKKNKKIFNEYYKHNNITIKSIAADLRAKGELDEEKYTVLRNMRIKHILWFSLMIIILGFYMWHKAGWIGISIIIFCGVVFVGGKIRYEPENKLAIMYTLGKKTQGSVIYAESDYSFDRGMPNKYIYRYEYFDNTSVRHEYLHEPSNYKMAAESRPEIGDKIDILYMEDNPEITVPFIEYLDEQFNLRKKL